MLRLPQSFYMDGDHEEHLDTEAKNLVSGIRHGSICQCKIQTKSGDALIYTVVFAPIHFAVDGRSFDAWFDYPLTVLFR